MIETPENLADYVKGHEGPPSPQELPEGYYDEVQAAIPSKSMMVYRAFTWGGPIEKADIEGGSRFNPFTSSDDLLISFTASKATALAIAEERSEDLPDHYVYAISMRIDSDAVYFHYMFNDIGRLHPKEKEIIIDPSGYDFKILKEHTPSE